MVEDVVTSMPLTETRVVQLGRNEKWKSNGMRGVSGDEPGGALFRGLVLALISELGDLESKLEYNFKFEVSLASIITPSRR